MSQALQEKQELHPMLLPQLTGKSYEAVPCKWADVRRDKVEVMRDRFRQSPATVLVLQDNKFENEHLAILKKSVFEELIKLQADFRSGEAAIRQSIDGVVSAVNTLLAAVIKEEEFLKKNEVLKHAVRSVEVQIEGIIKSTIVFASKPEDKGPVPLSESERELFEKLAEEDEG